MKGCKVSAFFIKVQAEFAAAVAIWDRVFGGLMGVSPWAHGLGTVKREKAANTTGSSSGLQGWVFNFEPNMRNKLGGGSKKAKT